MPAKLGFYSLVTGYFYTKLRLKQWILTFLSCGFSDQIFKQWFFYFICSTILILIVRLSIFRTGTGD
jgi:hypothetical protein